MLRTTLIAGLIVLLGGCETVGFYQQAAAGQWRLLAARQDLTEVMSDPGVPVEVRENLAYASRVIEFARDTLGIDADGRYQSYVALEQPYVVWNVFAAAEFDVAGYEWCYPLIGCAPYRGFFNEDDARRLAQRLREEEGYEVYVGGVPAYSTLGWFDDPLLSSFINWPAPDLAALIIHELAHGRVWKPSDVRFNENFASFVASQGLREWQVESGIEVEDWRRREIEWQQMKTLLLQLKDALSLQYELEGGDKTAAKQELYSAFESCYRMHQPVLGGQRFERLVANLNNAYLVSLGTYEDLQDFFAAQFQQSGQSWKDFFSRVDQLAELSSQDLERELAEFAEQQESSGADDHDADQVHCEALAGHSRDTKAPS